MNMIRFYQKHISPATQPTCRYHPTCSTYALEAVDKHGALKGGIMGTARILRCNPFVEGGVDRVPDYFTLKRNPANIGEPYIPDYLLSDPESKKEIRRLLEEYGEEVTISANLVAPLEVIREIVDLKELPIDELKKEFTQEELAYLQDMRVFPEMTKTEYRYYTLLPSPKNDPYLQEVHAYDEGLTLGEDYPLIILEETAVWYTNLPRLMNAYLIKRGVTEADVENKSYYLWMVLEAIAAGNKQEK